MPDPTITDERIAEIKQHIAYPHHRCKIAGASYPDILAIISRLERAEAERDAMKAVVDKLPRTADGVPIVPGMTVFHTTTRDAGKTWAVSKHRVSELYDMHGDSCLVIDPDEGLVNGMKPIKLWHSTLGSNRFFSTREAAIAAKSGASE